MDRLDIEKFEGLRHLFRIGGKEAMWHFASFVDAHFPYLSTIAQENESLSSQVQSLEAWKQEAIAVEKQWDVQKIGELVGATPGQHIRPLVQPFIESLKVEVERLTENLKEANFEKAQHQRNSDTLRAQLFASEERAKRFEAQMNALADPIVRAKMLEPPAPMILSSPVGEMLGNALQGSVGDVGGRE